MLAHVGFSADSSPAHHWCFPRFHGQLHQGSLLTEEQSECYQFVINLDESSKWSLAKLQYKNDKGNGQAPKASI